MISLVAILILGFALRIVNLNQSLWLDEAVQAITAQGSLGAIFSELQGDFHPPLYHLLMWGWVHLFGSTEIVLRLPSVLFGTATIYVIYLIGKQIFSKKLEIACLPASRGEPARQGNWKLEIPQIAALFLATAPFHIYYSQEARPYAIATFLTASSMYLFLREKWLGYIVSTVLALYSSYFVFFVVLVQTIIVFSRKQLWIYRYISISIILFLPWLPMLVTQFQGGYQAVSGLPEWSRLVNLSFAKALPLTFIKFSIGRIIIFNKILYLAVAGGLLIVYGLVIVRGFFKNKKLQITNSQLLIILWFLVPIFSAWLISFFIPNYQPFRLLLVLPAFYLLLALGVSSVRTTIIYIIVVMFLIGVNIISSVVYLTNSYFQREDWRGVVKFIETQDKPGVAILPSQTSNWPWRYYSTREVPVIGVSPGLRMVEESDFQKLSIYNLQFTIYYVYYLQPVFDPEEKIVSWLGNQGYAKIREVSFNQIPIWEYGLSQ